MSQTVFPQAEIRAFGLVRDATGKPKIDGDPRDLAPQIIAMMTEQEYETACKEYDECGSKN